MDKQRDKEKFLKKREAEMKLFNDQIQICAERSNSKRAEKLNQYEFSKKILKEYDDKMQFLEDQRKDYRQKIYDRRKVQDLREKLITNVADADNMVKNQYLEKFMKEKDEVEKRNRLKEDYLKLKNEEIMKDVKSSLSQMKEDKKIRDNHIKEIDIKYDNNIRLSYDKFQKEENDKELAKKLVKMRYKEDLDKQILSKNNNIKEY